VLIGYMVGGGTVEGVRAGGTNANFLSHHGKATHLLPAAARGLGKGY
jgi:hypothetical protein